MHRTKSIVYILPFLMTIMSCIRSYDPEIIPVEGNKYVVTGQISYGDSIQTVYISRTSIVHSPHFIGLDRCQVNILDDKGNTFFLSDRGNGVYNGFIDPEFIQPGTAYKVEIKTRTGEMFESDFDQLPNAGKIDSVYYFRKDIETAQPENFILGVQFYADMQSDYIDSRLYRWEIIDTWEYHTDYPLEWYYDGVVHHLVPPDTSKHICWKTDKISAIYTLSTVNLEPNKIKLFPLHFINNRSQKLAYGYSILVRLHSLSQPAYAYWDLLKLNNNLDGGLYEHLPIAVKGNIHNRTHPDSEILGFFGASSVTEKRVFIRPIPDFPLDFFNNCSPVELVGPFGAIKHSEYPVYLLGDRYSYSRIVLNPECVDCTKSGGTIVKPSFWPN